MRKVFSVCVFLSFLMLVPVWAEEANEIEETGKKEVQAEIVQESVQKEKESNPSPLPPGNPESSNSSESPAKIDAPPPSAGISVSLETQGKEERKAEVKNQPSKLMTLGGRFDAAYSSGGAFIQGFSIPSLRLTAEGEAGNFIDYRLSFAQTREYSTALLSQLLPSEAYVDLATNPVRNDSPREGSDLRLRVGMCSPLFVPWWTADLSDWDVPDYHEVHKANFASRDIGGEVAYRPFGESLTVAVGAFNGSGITAMNTNNSKAFTGHVHWKIPIFFLQVGLGNGTYFMEQSSPVAINYKRNWVTDLFLSLAWEEVRLSLFFDWFFSEYEDPTRLLRPRGFAVFGTWGFGDSVGVFSRYEFSSNSPQRGKLEAFQLGPFLKLSDYAKAFFIFQSSIISNVEERSVLLRLRLSI